MELEEASEKFVPAADRRPRIPEPPAVQLVAVADMELPGVAGRELAMDAFYVGVLGFERDGATYELVYRAENFRLRFRLLERPEPREDLRPVGVTVPSLPALMETLNEREIEFVRQRGFGPGEDSLLLRDPAGNWVEVSESKLIA